MTTVRYRSPRTARHNIGISFVSQELADDQAIEMDERGCIACVNCSICRNCRGCFDCSGCTGCTGCHDCHDCRNVLNCYRCSYCSQCQACENCRGCVCSYGCIGCERGVNLLNNNIINAAEREIITWLDNRQVA